MKKHPLQTQFFRYLIIFIILFIMYYHGKILKYINRFFDIAPRGAYYYLEVIGLLVLLIFIYGLFRRAKPKDFGFSMPSKNHIAPLILSLALVYPVTLIARIIDPSFDGWYTSVIGLFSLNTYLYMGIILIFASIIEELIYRAFLQSEVSRFNRPIFTIIFVAALFAILHFNYLSISLYHGIIIIISVFFSSIVLNTLFHYTNNIYVSILFHFFFNTLMLTQIYLHVSTIQFELFFWIIYTVFAAHFFKPSVEYLKKALKNP